MLGALRRLYGMPANRQGIAGSYRARVVRGFGNAPRNVCVALGLMATGAVILVAIPVGLGLLLVAPVRAAMFFEERLHQTVRALTGGRL